MASACNGLRDVKPRSKSSATIYIDSIPTKKIRPWPSALEEVQRMKEIDLSAQMETSMKFKIVSFNTLSLQKHYSDVKGDPKLHNADVVCLQETCPMDSDKNKEKYNLREFESHFNGVGRGKGIATFYSENFTFIKDIKMDSFQISKIESSEYSILNVYRSNDASMQFLHDLVSLIDLNKKYNYMWRFKLLFY